MMTRSQAVPQPSTARHKRDRHRKSTQKNMRASKNVKSNARSEKNVTEGFEFSVGVAQLQES